MLDALLSYLTEILPNTKCIAGHGDINTSNLEEGKEIASKMASTHNLTHQDCYTNP
jgi:hypothetical protein